MSRPAGGTQMRVILAAGDRALERRLVDELPHEGVTVVARCLDGASLVEECSLTPADAVLVSAGLHGLGDATLLAIREQRLPVVLMASDERQADRFATSAAVIPASAQTSAIAAALVAEASDGLQAAPPAVAPGRPDPGPVSTGAPEHRGHVTAVTSGKSAPGKTTLAIAVAAELAAQGYTTVLVDADLRGGNVAPYLGLDPRRGLVGLAGGDEKLGARVAGELQDGPGFTVLAGVERPDLARVLRPESMLAVVAALRESFDRVVLDLGVPADPALVRSARQLLVVTAADLVSLWNTRVALATLGDAVPGVATWVAINRREGQEHYDREEVEAALGLPVAGVVREDRAAARHAVERQVPLTTAGGRAADDLRRLVAAITAPAAADAGPTPRPLPRTAMEARA